MSSIQERLQLKRVPLDTWNIREQLCLASAVVRSGDQNWMSVSRALKTVGEPNRPADWYSQKSCAAQYGALLEHVETPKRKKRSSEGAVETPQESILKRLTQERIAEIQKNVQEMNRQYEQLKNEITEARNNATSEERLREMWSEIEAAKRTRERETARRAAWLRERDERRARAERTWRPPAHTPTAGAVASSPAPPSSPLLTSLLKSSPVVTTPQHMPHPASVVDTLSPSAGAPTLSMLLEKEGACGGAAGGRGLPPSPPPHPATPPHESKHAAIEHIKSQLQQIEHQLKACPGVALPAAVAPDIDDIEIKAEDVYAFRDIDIQIPPVPLHKPARVVEKPAYKKDEEEIHTPTVADVITEQVIEDIKDEPMAVETVVEDTPVVLETQQPCPEPPPAQEPAAEPPEAAPAPAEPAPPEVKFPSPEIKVLSDENTIKEEVKETEIAPEPEREQEVEVNVEDIVEVEQISEPEPQPTIEEPPQAPEPAGPPAEAEGPPAEPPLAPEDIPLPDTDLPPASTEEVTLNEIPLPPPEAIKEELVEEQLEEKEKIEIKAEVLEEERTEESKKDDDAEDSIPLKDMLQQEGARAGGEGARAGGEGAPGGRHEPDTEDTHTETDDDTPMELSREEEKDGKKKRDYSRKKKPDSRTCSGSESAAEASAPESPLASEAERQHRLWKKSVMLVYSRLCTHKYASLFLRPISDEEAPGYSLLIKRPMDLTSIRRNIENGLTRTTADFQRDVLLMLSNALMYNNSDHSVYQMTKEMFEEAVSQLGILVAAQAHAGLMPAEAELPARRKRRHKHDAASPAPPPQPLAKRHV